jgi:hypothetical protein
VIQIGKEEVKLSLFADDVILYLKDPEDATRRLLDLINTFIKAAGHKMNMQVSIAYLYTNNRFSEEEIIMNFIHHSPHPPLPKYLGIKLKNENYKTPRKEIGRWKNISCSWIGRINISKMAVLLKVIYKFNEIPTKTPKKLFM